MFRPILAPLDDPLKNPNFFEGLRYPLLVSPKLDGIRGVTRRMPILDIDEDFCEVHTGAYSSLLLSRTLTELPSRQAQEAFSTRVGLDGELIAGSETDFGVYNRTQSHIMSANKPSELLSFRVFDTCDEEMAGVAFEDRLEYARSLIAAYAKTISLPVGCSVSLVEHRLCNNYDDLMLEEDRVLALGYEGLMLRTPDGPYKHNRVTFLEGYFWKLKRFQDDEGIIVEFEEGTRNTNEKTTDNKGYAERSTRKEGLVPSGTLGKFIVDFNGIAIKVAPGAFSHKDRKAIFDDQERFRFKTLKFRHLAHGATDLPRHARAVGFRDKMDM